MAPDDDVVLWPRFADLQVIPTKRQDSAHAGIRQKARVEVEGPAAGGLRPRVGGAGLPHGSTDGAGCQKASPAVATEAKVPVNAAMAELNCVIGAEVT